jgi:glycosyltransferase involved in cell wall biosynthesis
MPEIAGEAAFMIDPFKPEEISAAMAKLTSDQDLRRDLIRKGILQAAKFTWRSMAEQVLVIYNAIHNQPFKIQK